MSAVNSTVSPETEDKDFWSNFLWSWHNRTADRGVIFAPHPQFVFLNRERVSFIVSSGIFILLGLAAIGGTIIVSFRDALAHSNLISYSPSFIDEPSGWLLGWSYAAVLIVSCLIHESGHWLAFKLTGRQLKILSIGGRMSVTADRNPANSYQALLISSSGGIFEAAFGFCILATQGGFGWSGLQIIAFLVILNGVANLILPLRPGSDGTRVWSSLGSILIGRGGRALER